MPSVSRKENAERAFISKELLSLMNLHGNEHCRHFIIIKYFISKRQSLHFQTTSMNLPTLQVLTICRFFSSLEFCNSEPLCKWFTFFSHSSYCEIFQDCLDLDPEICSDCLSGQPGKICCSINNLIMFEILLLSESYYF